MRIRLHGTPTEIVATITAPRKILEIRDESRPYLDRPPSTLARVYLDATVRAAGEDG